MNIVIKEFIRGLLKYSPKYKKYFNVLNQELTDFEIEEKLELVKNNIIDNVPYYNKINKKINFIDIPFLTKNEMCGNEHLFVDKKFNYKKLIKKSTGGSTGTTLKIYKHKDDVLFENAMSAIIFSKIEKNNIVGVLRGQKPKKSLFQRVTFNKYILSSYDLSASNIDEYIDFINKKRITCLHVYPSSFMIFTNLVMQKYQTYNFKYLKGIVSSSEILTYEDKKKILKVFPNIKLVDYYGHNELACCAFSEGLNHYKFNYNFGYVEFIDTGDKINGNSIKEIVATSIINNTMPFLRYRTEDFVEIDDNNNIISIIGRSSDYIVNKNEELAPCIILTRAKTLLNVINFQYHQNKIGELNFRVIVNDKFNDTDMLMIKEDIESSFSNNIIGNVVVVETIERTKAGKQKRLIQELNIDIYKSNKKN